MSELRGWVFGGDQMRDSDTARCERLLGAAQALWPGDPTRLLLGPGSALDVGRAQQGVPQDATPVLTELQAKRARSPGLCFAFSSNDRFSGHVARLLAAQSGMPLLGPVAAARRHHAVCARRNGEAIERALGPGQILLIDERYFRRRAWEPGHTQMVAAAARAGATSFIDVPVAAGAAPLSEADLVFSAGDGITDWDSFAAVAALLGATVGGTKVVCDKGLLARDRQVGSSGSTVAPCLYLALGISGSTQHLQGIGESTHILAVNTDPNASIMRRAELALVTDANALLRHLRAVLESESA